MWYTCSMKPLVHLKPRSWKALPVMVDATTPFPASVLLTASFDGACSPNPGPMGVGYQISLPLGNKERPRDLVKVGAPIGKGTNNEAEWQAFLALLRHALRLGFWELQVTSDSLLVTNQFKGQWKAKGRLARLRDEAQNLGRLFTRLTVDHVFREQNTDADKLSRELTFDEPQLPLPKPHTNSSRKPRALLDWQAAAIRIWSLKYHPGSGTLSRVFGITKPAIESIAEGRAYRNADFSTYQSWIESLDPLRESQLYNPIPSRVVEDDWELTNLKAYP